MIILMHIIIALATIAVATVSYFKPTKTIFKTTVGLTAITIASGTYLTIQNPSHLLQTCMSGLVFVGIVFAISALAWARAIKQEEI